MRLLSLLFAFGLVAAACGGGSDGDAADKAKDDGAGGIDTDAAEKAVAGSQDDETTTTAEDEVAMADPTNITELEAVWEANRQKVLDRVTEEGYGLGDDGILTGPEGFTIDTNNCPVDWDNTEGIGDTIKIGHTTTQSGNLAAYGNIAIGMDAYFDYVNENGGIGGIPIELITKDDGYVATVTIEMVDELLQADKPLMINTLGSPNTLAVYDTLNEKCVPQPFVMTGHPAWGDPEGHPWTTGDQMSYSTEAILWGAWLKTNMAADLPVTVAGLVMDNDFGLAYEDGMNKYAAANPDVVSKFTAVRHDPAAPTVTNEMTTIAAGAPDVFISMTAGNPCLLAVEEAGRSGMADGETVLFMPSVCKDPNSFMIPAGDVANGWNIVGGGLKVTTDPQYADDVYIKFLNETLAAAELDTTIGAYGTGFGLFAWPIVESLRLANEMEGGLTRTNLILAVRVIDLEHPQLLDGITFSMNGNKDGYPIEGSDFAVYDSATASWVTQGSVVDLNGSSPSCSWGPEGCG